MNAYELADDVLDINKLVTRQTVASALRQQADRIAELEKQIKDAVEVGIAEGFVRANQQSEPYVWHMKANDPDFDKDYWYFIDKPSRESKVSHSAIPLYTTPQTKLSDEEIREVWYGHPEFQDGLGVDPIPFARAIEAKVRGEK
jgi:hypothetical protein